MVPKRKIKGVIGLLLATCLFVSKISYLNAWTTNPPQWVKDLPALGLIPDPLIKSDGNRITSASEWSAQKNYLIGQIKQCITGTYPPLPNVTGSASFSSGGSQYVTLRAGGVNINITLYYPSGSSSSKYPAIILSWIRLNFAVDPPNYGCIGVAVGTDDALGSLGNAFPGYSWGELMKIA